MEKKFFALTVIFCIAVISGAIAYKLSFISFVFVPTATAPSDACTVQLFGYTATNNGAIAITRTASSAPTTSGCRVISIYPNP